MPGGKKYRPPAVPNWERRKGKQDTGRHRDFKARQAACTVGLYGRMT